MIVARSQEKSRAPAAVLIPGQQAGRTGIPQPPRPHRALAGACGGSAIAWTIVRLATPPPATTWTTAAYVAAALCFAAIARRPRPGELSIHDRHVDTVLSAVLFVLSWLLARVTATVHAASYQRWNLGWVAAAVFAAGVCALLAGVRQLWRQRATLLLIALAGPVCALPAAAHGPALVATVLYAAKVSWPRGRRPKRRAHDDGAPAASWVAVTTTALAAWAVAGPHGLAAMAGGWHGVAVF